MRWIRRLAACLAALVALFVLAVLVLVHSLDRPWLKHRFQVLAHESAGIDLDYDAAAFHIFSGLTLDGLVVRSPPALRALAPELAHVGHVEAAWSVASLRGTGPAVERLTVSNVTLSVVVDEQGRTSFDALFPPAPSAAKPSPPVPLSHQAGRLAVAPPLGHAEITGVSATLVRTAAGRIVERTQLRGIALTLDTSPSPKGGWRVIAGLGTSTAPLDLTVTRERSGSAAGAAHAKLWLALDTTSSNLTLALDARVLEQTLAPDVDFDRSLHAEVSAAFDAKAGRTVLTIHDAQAGEGAATAEASLEVPDAGDPFVRHAQGDLDVARLLRWLPASLVPVTVEHAHVRYAIDGLSLGPVVHLADGGTASLDADLANVHVTTADAPIEVGGASVSIRARPLADGGVAGSGTIQVSSARLDVQHLAVDDVVLDLDAQQSLGGEINGRVGAHVARLALAGGVPIVARGAHIEVRADRVRPDATSPLATRGDVTLALDVPSLDARPGATRVLADGLALHLHTLLEGHPPYAAQVEATATALRVLGQGSAPLVDSPIHFQATVRDVTPDLVHPIASHAAAHVAVDLGDAKTSLDATKASDAVDFALQLAAPSLKPVRPFLTPVLAKQVPWNQIGVTVRSSGRVDHIASGAPSVDQTTDVEVEHPAFEDTMARAVSLKLTSKGDALVHQADLDLRAQALTVTSAAPSDDHITVSAALDRPRRSLRVAVATEGRVAANVTASASFDPSRRAVPYAIEAHLANLAPLAPLFAKIPSLADFDLSQLDLAFASKGALFGAVADVGRDSTLRLEPHPTRTAAVEGTADLHVAHFHWSHGDDAVIVPALAWHGELQTAGAHRSVRSHIEVEAVHLDVGPKDVDLSGIRDDSSIVLTGDLADPQSALTQHTTIAGVVQDVVTDYPVGDLGLVLAAERDPNGLIHLTNLKLTNGAGGTSLALSGNVQLGAARHTLSVTTSVEQDLARLTRAPERFRGRGIVGVEANVASPNLARFRVHGSVTLRDVFASLPRNGIDLQGATGEVPVTASLELDKNGVALTRDEESSPYSTLRFADQHPLLNRSGVISIASLKTPLVTIAPLVGNLEVEQRQISLRQFEMGVRGGSITGQCGLNWDGPKSTLELHVRATGVQSSHGEPFDGNVAVIISAADRTVEGRAEVLRIGERHLLDLLDMQDPTHVDPAMNRIRTALLFGYPDRLRLVFDHGFASARLELGGLAKLVSISELRGIPMGPLIDKFLTPESP